MIIAFMELQAAKGAAIHLSIWDDIPHNFQAYDSAKTSSSETLEPHCKCCPQRGGKTFTRKKPV